MAQCFALVVFLLCAASIAHAVPCLPEDCEAVSKKDGDTITIASKQRDLCSCTCDIQGKTILHLAGPVECGVCINSLLTPPPSCDVDVFDYNYNTPLHDAAAVCQSPSTSQFLTFGADTSLINYDGYTPLCLAALNSIAECGGVIQAIVMEGNADVCQPCNDVFPIDLATQQGSIDILVNLGGDQCSP